MASKKPPQKLYVVSAKVASLPNAKPRGQFCDYKPGVPTYENRMRVIEKNTYLYNTGLYAAKIEKDYLGDWYLVGEKYDYSLNWNSPKKIPVRDRIETPPQIWDNVPMPGFKLAGIGYKCWRVEDPRGIDFELSFECVQEIIDTQGIAKGGIIEGNCLWMANKKLIVVS